MQSADYYRGKILRMAKEHSKKYPCPKCKSKKRKSVPLFEYGDMEMPSSVMLYCKKCNTAEPFATADDDQAHAYERQIGKEQKQSNSGIIIP